jgi:hypothetical protein
MPEEEPQIKTIASIYATEMSLEGDPCNPDNIDLTILPEEPE